MVLQSPRNPQTIEWVWAEAINILGVGVVAHELGKSTTLIYAWSNPEDDAHVGNDPLHLFMVDKLCAKKTAGERMPHAEWYKRRVRNQAGLSEKSNVKTPGDHSLAMMKEMGDIARCLTDSDADNRITRAEAAQVAKEAAECVRAIDACVADINQRAGIEDERDRAIRRMHCAPHGEKKRRQAEVAHLTTEALKRGKVG